MSVFKSSDQSSVKLEFHCPEEMETHPAAQRDFVESNFRRLTRSWDRTRCGVLQAQYRPGQKLGVFIGQHRRAAAEHVDPTFSMPVLVYYGISDDDTKRRFLADDNTTRIHSVDKHYIARDVEDEASAVERELTRWGLHVGKGQGPRRIQAVKKLYAAYRVGTLPQVLGLIADVPAWADDHNAYAGDMLVALAKIIKANAGQIEYQRLISTLSRRDVSAWIHYGRQSGKYTGHSGVAGLIHVIVLEYNGDNKGNRRLGDARRIRA